MVPHSELLSPQPNKGCRLCVDKLGFLEHGPFSFTLKKGECTGLSGRSGVGKTLILRAITDLIPHTGQLLLDGKSCSSFDAPHWRSLVTMVPAESFWWFDTVGEHYLLFDDRKLLRKRLAFLGFDDDVLAWDIARLSTGEKQRLALVRGLSNNPQVLLLDEPSSSLDSHHTDLLETVISNYLQNDNGTVLWVSHDPDQLQRVTTDTVMYMEQNELIIQKTVSVI